MSLGAGQESTGAESGETGPQLICSAKGCRAVATIDLTWRNPSLHHGGRVKHWLACGDHADHLADFLHRRDFLLERGPLR
ncbi:acetone carboxylase [Jatrophihabitans fulvus]